MSQTLVLNQSWQPAAVVPWQRAMTLFFQEKVEIVREYEDRFIRSAKASFKMPAVVRLLSTFKRRRKPVKFSRINIASRDKNCCQYCGTKLKLSEITYDHVVPRSQGGTTCWTNIVAACTGCNAQKGGRTPEQAGMRILTRPARPAAVDYQSMTFSHRSIPDAWRDFCYWKTELDQD